MAQRNIYESLTKEIKGIFQPKFGEYDKQIIQNNAAVKSLQKTTLQSIQGTTIVLTRD